MTTSSSLKKEIRPLVVAAIAAHLVAFGWAVAVPFELAIDWHQKLGATLSLGAAFFTFACLVALVARGFFPSTMRDRLVHWRWNCPLPGGRAFTIIGPRDPRVDMKKLRKKFGPLPRAQDKQNTKFYEIYNGHRDNPAIVDAHKSYLAARDIAVITLVFTIFLPAAAFVLTGDSNRAVIYGLLLVITFFVISLAAKVYGRRLVENTLAVACNSAR